MVDFITWAAGDGFLICVGILSVFFILALLSPRPMYQDNGPRLVAARDDGEGNTYWYDNYEMVGPPVRIDTGGKTSRQRAAEWRARSGIADDYQD